jgi:outer membrane putative beta-barrel porin/alpha-amylase
MKWNNKMGTLGQCTQTLQFQKALSLVIIMGIVGWHNDVWSGPITFNSAIGLAENEFVLREQIVLNQSSNDPSGVDRDRTSQQIVSVLGYAFSSDFMLIGVLPYIDNDLDINVTGMRQNRSVDNLGDLRLFGRYTLFRRNWPGGTLRVSPFAGLEMPTGQDDEQDSLGKLPASVQPGSGSWDPFGGLVLTYQTLDFEIDTAISYQVNTEANDFEFGDVARFDASLQYRLWPRKLKGGVPGFLYGVLETNLIYKNKNSAFSVKDANSGGTTLFMAPGLQYVTRRWVIETALQLPVVQDLNGTALENDFILRAGFRVNF